jgi:hypothetical protein
MINHKYKCIFIHIQRTAGSHIETLIDGVDWWTKSKTEKHLICSQAREAYFEYWEDYFKFSIVRNPWARTASCLKWPEFFGLKIIKGKIDMSDYKKRYGFPNTVEYDHRFHKATDIPNGQKGSAYSNILNEKLDFVAKYENLQSDMEFIFDKIKLNKRFKFKEGESQNYRKYFTKESRMEVENMYYMDNKKYDYVF